MGAKQKIKIHLGTFDFIKGIAIIAVIISHMRWRYDIEEIPSLAPVYLVLGLLGPGLMPLFFLISGYGFKPKLALQTLKKSFSELIVPYLIAVPVFFVMFFVFQYPLFYPVQNLLKTTMLRMGGYVLGIPRPGYFFGHDYISAGPLWFFLALFLATNVLNMIVKRNLVEQIILVLLCTLSGFLLLKLNFLFFSIPQGLLAVAFCYTGFCFKKYNVIDQLLYSKRTYVCLIPVWLLMSYGVLTGNAGFDMADGRFTVLEYLAAGCTGVLFFFVSIYCSRFTWSGLDWVSKIGVYSYWIIYVHAIEMLALPWYEISQNSMCLHVTFLIETLLRIIVLMVGCMIFKKISLLRHRGRMNSSKMRR